MGDIGDREILDRLAALELEIAFVIELGGRLRRLRGGGRRQQQAGRDKMERCGSYGFFPPGGQSYPIAVAAAGQSTRASRLGQAALGVDGKARTLQLRRQQRHAVAAVNSGDRPVGAEFVDRLVHRLAQRWVRLTHSDRDVPDQPLVRLVRRQNGQLVVGCARLKYPAETGVTAAASASPFATACNISSSKA